MPHTIPDEVCARETRGYRRHCWDNRPNWNTGCGLDNTNMRFSRFDNCTMVSKRIVLTLGTTKARLEGKRVSGSWSTLKGFGKHVSVGSIWRSGSWEIEIRQIWQILSIGDLGKGFTVLFLTTFLCVWSNFRIKIFVSTYAVEILEQAITTFSTASFFLQNPCSSFSKDSHLLVLSGPSLALLSTPSVLSEPTWCDL